VTDRAVDNDALNFNNGGPVDILAPGVGVVSSIPNDNFGGKSGTSMATPHVTGAFAVIRNIVGASWSVGDILTLLQNTAPLVTDMRAANNPGGGGTLTGYVKPRLQLDAAVADLLPADLRVLKDCKPDSPFPRSTNLCRFSGGTPRTPKPGNTCTRSSTSFATITVGPRAARPSGLGPIPFCPFAVRHWARP
jgi:subtilisin family serine protease